MKIYRVGKNKIYEYEIIRETKTRYVTSLYLGKYISKRSKYYYRSLEEALQKLEPYYRKRFEKLKKQFEETSIIVDAILDKEENILKNLKVICDAI